jgi:hypothetical protein
VFNVDVGTMPAPKAEAYLRKMIQEDPINTGYNQNVYKLALELARLKSKI